MCARALVNASIHPSHAHPGLTGQIPSEGLGGGAGRAPAARESSRNPPPGAWRPDVLASGQIRIRTAASRRVGVGSSRARSGRWSSMGGEIANGRGGRSRSETASGASRADPPAGRWVEPGDNLGIRGRLQRRSAASQGLWARSPRVAYAAPRSGAAEDWLRTRAILPASGARSRLNTNKGK